MFKNLVLTTAAIAILAACGGDPRGSSSSSDVVRSGLVNNWVSSNGDNLLIQSDNFVTDESCVSQGNIGSVTQFNKCSDAATCGTMSISVASGNSGSGCLQPGVSVCNYSTFASDGETELKLECPGTIAQTYQASRNVSSN